MQIFDYFRCQIINIGRFIDKIQGDAKFCGGKTDVWNDDGYKIDWLRIEFFGQFFSAAPSGKRHQVFAFGTKHPAPKLIAATRNVLIIFLKMNRKYEQ